MRKFLPSMLCCTVVVVVAFAMPVAARGHAQAQPKPSVPPTAECWTVTGPHGSGREVYFDASNNCPEPRHCRVWVNWHEPPSQVHLDIGMKGHIDVGATEPGDKFSYDCVPVSPGM
jgi:hypothetical protein